VSGISRGASVPYAGREEGDLVLVSPIAFRSVDWDRETLDVALTRQQVEQSPSITTDQPVSRQQVEEYSRYYGYPYY
jgi:hypothetical protein